jgi:Cu/Zn superoxide dismutase
MNTSVSRAQSSRDSFDLRRMLLLGFVLMACTPLETTQAQTRSPESRANAVAIAMLENERLENLGVIQFTPIPDGLEINIRLVRVLPGTYSLVLHQGGSCKTLGGTRFGAAGDTFHGANAPLQTLRIGPSGTGQATVKRNDLGLIGNPTSILGRTVIVWSRTIAVACGVIQAR